MICYLKLICGWRHWKNVLLKNWQIFTYFQLVSGGFKGVERNKFTAASELWFLERITETEKCFFLYRKMLIVTVGLGNCIKGGRNWHLEKKIFSLDYPQQGTTWLYFCILSILPSSAVCSVSGKGRKYVGGLIQLLEITTKTFSFEPRQ